MPSQCDAFIGMKRSRRLVCAKPYGTIQSAKTAEASITNTMTPPMVPSGFRLTICTHTSTYHGHVRGMLRRATATPAPTAAGSGLAR